MKLARHFKNEKLGREKIRGLGRKRDILAKMSKILRTFPCHSFIQSRTYHWWPPISLDIHKRRVKGNHRTSIEHKKTK